MLATKLDDLSSTLGTHMVKGEFHKSLISTCAMVCRQTQTRVRTRAHALYGPSEVTIPNAAYQRGTAKQSKYLMCMCVLCICKNKIYKLVENLLSTFPPPQEKKIIQEIH